MDVQVGSFNLNKLLLRVDVAALIDTRYERAAIAVLDFQG